MNYRHAYHAGNFADVLKHAAIIAVLTHLRKKPAPFAVIDTHAGRGLYDLTGVEAQKTLEAEHGFLRLKDIPELPPLLQSYRDIADSFGDGRYPGSPLLAAKLLRERDRLVAIEKHPEEFAVLREAAGADRRLRLLEGDGYRQLGKLLPPPERRALVLVDPPYEATDEFQAAVRALIAAYRRFSGGIFLLWYPAKERSSIAAAAGELLNAGVRELLRIELDVGGGEGERLSATGLLVINPPFGFAAEMRGTAEFLANALARGRGASSAVEVLAGEG